MFCFKSSTLDGVLYIYKIDVTTVTIEIKRELKNDTCYHKVRTRAYISGEILSGRMVGETF